MLLVRTQLAPSAIHGVGLFAAEKIAVGTPIWRFELNFDLLFSDAQIQGLAEPARQAFMTYTYYNEKLSLWVYCLDNGRFLNHSDQPNTAEDYRLDPIHGVDFALRDIAQGEEITSDYRSFDQGTYDRFFADRRPHTSSYQISLAALLQA
jgi:uncharacterized protein